MTKDALSERMRGLGIRDDDLLFAQRFLRVAQRRRRQAFRPFSIRNALRRIVQLCS
jgi:hypothetical protein